MFVAAVASATIVGAALVTAPQAPTIKHCTIASGTYQNFKYRGVDRKFKAYIPPGATSQTKLIISMHGATGSSESQENMSGFTWFGQRDNFAAVYPQALGAPQKTVWDIRPGGNDIGYVTELTKFLHASGCGSPNTTYINGFSMGAMMTSTLMCTSGHLYAGAAMVSGVLDPLSGCVVGKNKPILIVHGMKDFVVPYDGSMSANVALFVPRTAISKYNRQQMARHWQLVKRPSSVTAVVKDTPLIKYVTYSSPATKDTKIVILKDDVHVWDADPRRNTVSTTKLILEAMK